MLDLNEILDQHIIQVSFEAEDKHDALEKMSQMLLREGYINNVEQFVQDIYEREAEGVTGIGNGVAIPHGKSNSVQRMGIAIVVLKEGIQWESLDGKDVHAIFLFCVSNNHNFAKNHMILLSKIAAKLADDELLKHIVNAESSKQVKQLLIGDSHGRT